MPEPLSISSTARERLIATSYNGESILYDVIMKQEFLPKVIGESYGFPQPDCCFGRCQHPFHL